MQVIEELIKLAKDPDAAYAFGERRQSSKLPGTLRAEALDYARLHCSLRLARGPPVLGKQLGDVFRRGSLNPEQDIGQVLVGIDPGEEAAGDDGV